MRVALSRVALSLWVGVGVSRLTGDDWSHRAFGAKTAARYSRDDAAARRDLSAAVARAPLRVAPYYDSLAELSAAQAQFLQGVLMPAVVAEWARLLSVERVDGPLLLDRPCDYVWNDDAGCALQCASVVAQPTCLDIAMPAAHFAAATYCETGRDEGCASTAAGAGVDDADFVVYASAWRRRG